ncbi:MULTISPECIES: hypothetical protein [unclassified Mesorhizobium]|uniref:hypothetical protein n=1 Tax=unclassified Mesorhizobium TaxID=325217 RepID=UPI0024157E6E|nr:MULTISPECIES: hypothetical protein [unclassified Mesorhizobium]MDG4904557.1 hypothetical protein [Mesorhizobium sp. WSM4962]MDG4906269.1 hypothetical protein [Mesorhizobium sp. WSM4898]MDG4920301.1 hypothetical protein [Mesorhizobium sp. WSM4989]
MIGELKVSVLTAGGAALVAEDGLHQIPVQASMVRPEPLTSAATSSTADRRQVRQQTDRPVPASSFLPSGSSVKGNFIVMAILVKWGRRTGEDYIPDLQPIAKRLRDHAMSF